MNKKPARFDILLLSAFVILISFQPFFLHHEIIMMETGIHLPALNALFHGQIPYRDFYFLRGPLELYVPALMMVFGGKNAALLPLFYYGGTVLTFLFCVLVAGHFFRTRWIFYLMIPVLVARTFPRVSYYYWGGMRYAIGFLALWLGIMFFKTQRKRWIFLAGFVSCFAFLTTVEAGVSVTFAFAAALGSAYILKVQPRDLVLKSAGMYALGFLIILISYFIYLAATSSLMPFLEAQYVVLTKMTQTFVDAKGNHPESFIDFLFALFPNSPYFKIMTPVYTYIFCAAYIVSRIKRNNGNWDIPVLISLAVYGIILYIGAFRKIEGHHFEMALQPEKFLLFFMFEEVWLKLQSFRICVIMKTMSRMGQEEKQSFIKRLFPVSLAGGRPYEACNDKKWDTIKLVVVYLILMVFVAGSLGYAIQRYDHRFTMFKWIKKEVFQQKVKGLSLLENMESETLHLKRVDGITVPKWQAEEIRGVVEFLEENTAPDEAVFTYPELGNFNFYADRPFVGRFPIATFTWMEESWHQELLADFKNLKPRYVVMTNLGHRTFPRVWYFRNPKNKDRFDTFAKLILDDYEVVGVFPSVSIYRRRF